MKKSFNERCYEVVRGVPKGKVVTYKEIARKLGSRAYRAVGSAMKKNKDKNVRCYKVVKSGGEVGGFNKGVKEKIKLLRKEGIEVVKEKRKWIIDLEKYNFSF